MTAYTQRVKVGAVYTDGEDIWTVHDVNPLGWVSITSEERRKRPGLTGHTQLAGIGIDAFRRRYWLVKAAPSESAVMEPSVAGESDS